MSTPAAITHRTTETVPDGGPAHPALIGEKPPLRDAARSPVPSLGPVVSRDWRAVTWALLLVVSGAQLLDGLDVSMAGVALPSIGRQLHLPASSLQWIVSGYVLGFGGFLLLGGRTSDLLGRRRVFLTALAVFGVASVAGGLVSNEFALIALGFVKGVSAGFTGPRRTIHRHDFLRGGSAESAGPRDLHGVRCERFHPGAGRRRAAHRAQLAGDAHSARTGGPTTRRSGTSCHPLSGA